MQKYAAYIRKLTDTDPNYVEVYLAADARAEIIKKDNLIVEQGMQIEETYKVLRGEGVSDFSLSFGLVSKAADVKADARAVEEELALKQTDWLEVCREVDALKEERDRLRGENDDRFIERFLMVRGIETLCHKCSGAGKVAYPNTSVWMGGIGGQMITTGVCDHCWGSGDEHRHGANLRKLTYDIKAFQSKIASLTAEIAGMREALEMIASVEDCGCGVPCDCHSWWSLVVIAQKALGKEQP